MAKDVMLVSAGVLGVLACQRYGKQITNKAVKTMDDAVDSMSKKTRMKKN